MMSLEGFACRAKSLQNNMKLDISRVVGLHSLFEKSFLKCKINLHENRFTQILCDCVS